MHRLLLLLLLLPVFFSCHVPAPAESGVGGLSELIIVHTIWLLLLSGFSAAILFFIWKNLAGYGRLHLSTLSGIITQKIGDEKNDLGILALSLAILCWFISGIFSLVPSPVVSLLATSICSSLNSCFLLLFLQHLDKEDLPPQFRSHFPSRHAIWTAFIILVLVTLTTAWPIYTGDVPGFAMLLPDLGFSLYTLYFIGFSFYYLLKARMKSIEIAILSCVPILITLLAEVSRLISVKYPDQLDQRFLLANHILLFAYKPLLIISYFVLIYSWQLKRIARKQSPSIVPSLQATAAFSNTDVSANRAQYRLLGPKDWVVLESLARGEKATTIAVNNPQEFPNGAKGVDDRIGAIAREFQLDGQSQMKIVVTALKRGLIKLEDIQTDTLRH